MTQVCGKDGACLGQGVSHYPQCTPLQQLKQVTGCHREQLLHSRSPCFCPAEFEAVESCMSCFKPSYHSTLHHHVQGCQLNHYYQLSLRVHCTQSKKSFLQTETNFLHTNQERTWSRCTTTSIKGLTFGETPPAAATWPTRRRLDRQT